MVQVTVNEGTLEGELINNEFGGKFYSFKGIPYAEPPVGNLRFKAPQPLKPWKGVRNAKQFGSECYQVDSARSPDPVGSEDCLYLNVYTPDLKPSKPLPVLFYIHGGAFVTGSGNDHMHGPHFLVRHEIILVTINYRLGALGFLCLDTEDIPGNAGMKDQVAALRWVNKNIQNFGGDSNNITIYGHSAGAGCVSHHLVSPMTKGLFKKAIPQSGANTCFWGVAFEPRDKAITLAKQLGCYFDDNKQLYEFFKSVPVESLVKLNLSNTLSEAHKETGAIHFTVVNEKQFGNNERYFHGDIFDIMRNGVHEGVEIMTGFTEDEGYIGLRGVNLERVVTQINSFNDFLTPTQISLQCPLSAQIKAGKKMKEIYFNKGQVTVKDIDRYTKYLSMDMFVYGIIEAAKMCVKARNKLYLYKFTCKTERNFFGADYLGMRKIIGNRTIVCHADDLPYIFSMTIVDQKVDVNSQTFKIMDNVQKLWTNFVKYGNPTPDESLGVKWMPYTLETQDYLDIGNQLVTRKEPEKDVVEIWENIFREFSPHFVYQ